MLQPLRMKMNYKDFGKSIDFLPTPSAGHNFTLCDTLVIINTYLFYQT